MSGSFVIGRSRRIPRILWFPRRHAISEENGSEEDEVVVGAGNRYAAMGASNVAQVGVPPNIESDGFMYFVWFGANANGRFRYHPPVATGGQTVATTLSRVSEFLTLVGTWGCLPSHCILQLGRNDMIGAAITHAATVVATVEQLCDALLALGILPIVTGLLPSDSPTSIAQTQRNTAYYNMGLALMAQKKGLTYIDPLPAIVDVTTGGIPAAYAATGAVGDEHLNSEGCQVVGDYIASKLLLGGASPYWDVPLAYSGDSNTDDAYLLTNMLMLADTGGQPTNWTEGGADVANLVTSTVSASADGVLGDWMKMVKASSAGDAQNQSASMTVVPGNWVAVGWADKFVYASGAPVVTTFLRAGSTDLAYKRIQSTQTSNIGVSKHFTIVKIPPGETSASLRVVMHAVGEYYLGQVTIMDLTAADLDTWI